jgi:hypothetical protein
MAARCHTEHLKQRMLFIWRRSQGGAHPSAARSGIRRWRLKTLELIIRHAGDYHNERRPQRHRTTDCQIFRSSLVEYREHWCPFYPGYRAGDYNCKWYSRQALLSRYRAAASAFGTLKMKIRAAHVRQKIYEWDYKLEEHRFRYQIHDVAAAD